MQKEENVDLKQVPQIISHVVVGYGINLLVISPNSEHKPLRKEGWEFCVTVLEVTVRGWVGLRDLMPGEARGQHTGGSNPSRSGSPQQLP